MNRKQLENHMWSANLESTSSLSRSSAQGEKNSLHLILHIQLESQGLPMVFSWGRVDTG